MSEPVVLQRFDGLPDVYIEAFINPIDGCLEITRISDGEATDGIRLSASGMLLLEEMLAAYVSRKSKELSRTRARLRSWAKRMTP